MKEWIEKLRKDCGQYWSIESPRVLKLIDEIEELGEKLKKKGASDERMD